MIDTEALRKHTLDLATHGELSRNVRCAENANSLYARIQLVREKLTESKQLKNNEVVQPLVKNEPYKLPSNWKWVCMGNIFNIVSARRVHKADWRQKGIPFYRAREISKLAKFGEVRNDLFIDNSLYEKFAKSGVPQPGDLMVTAVGTLGQTYVVKKKDKFYYKDASVLCLENYGNLVPEYVKIVMDSPMMADQINNNTFGTTVRTLTIAKLNRYFFPLPPLEEQLKIVESIKEIFNQLEVIDTFQSQYTTNISALNKKILDLTVQGKLVPQDSSDEPASMLLEKIAAEKQKLIQEGKIKKQKKLPAITEDEIPFEIPKGWEWVRLGDVTKSIADGDHQAPPQTKNGVPFLVISNLSSGYIDFSNTRFVSKEYYTNLSDDRKAEQGDIIFTVTGSYGISIKVETSRNFCFQRHMALLKPMINSDFLIMLLRSPLIQNQCDRVATGTAQKTVGLTSLRNMIVPIPPVEEQVRILRILKSIMPEVKRIKK